VLAFSYLSTQIAHDEMALSTSAGELIDTIEGWGDEDRRRLVVSALRKKTAAVSPT
jgi:hypothetical protein